MENMKELAESLHLNHYLRPDDIPDLNLYMDQVIQLFERQFDNTTRYPDDKVLTKTMINNYAKGKLFFPVENKKYTKEHLLLISMIYQMKGALSISDVKTALNQLNYKVTDEGFDLQQFYEQYLQLLDDNVNKFSEAIQDQQQEVSQTLDKAEGPDRAYLEQLLLIAVFTAMSNYYRRAAEKLVDDLATDMSNLKEGR
ncbi:DUF1836 domain-containing protein [Barrientosiimonas marina]|uniref:DUF1836 domain-containing protein n=1 Tax=Lentibacillus kimchii TaxID=1542911 RepID=A0ABW2USA5_9BACI